MIKNYTLQGKSLVQTDSDEPLVQVYVNPDADERNQLRELLDLDEHTLASTLDPDEISRVEHTPDYLLIIWKRPTSYTGGASLQFDVVSVGLFLYENRLVIVAKDDLDLSSLPKMQLHDTSAARDILLALLFSTVHHFLGHLKAIKMLARDIQEKINTSMENRHLIQMFNLTESLIFYINSISANASAIDRLRGQLVRLNADQDAFDFLDDIVIENNQCLKQAEIYSSVLSGLMDARGNLVNNNMNLLLKNLTTINVVFLPLNLIASIGGMSEFSRFTEHFDWRISYFGFCLGMVIIGWLTAVLLNRMDFGVTGSSRKKAHRSWLPWRR